MTEKLKKSGYTAPRMEATSFKTENGYATSGGPATKSFTIGVMPDSLQEVNGQRTMVNGQLIATVNGSQSQFKAQLKD